MTEECEHKWVYGGVKYEHAYQLSGSAAKRRFYYDWFYCDKCLEKKYQKLNIQDQSSYSGLLFNATPK